MSLKVQISEDMKASLRAREARRLSALRLVLAAIKQREVDERRDMSDADVVAILEKMVKQRRESITQFRAGGRDDLARIEEFELELVQGYLPPPLTGAEIDLAVAAAIAETGAMGTADMGKVMALIKARLAGRADLSKVSAAVKAKLAG
jgi:uncharacterized protein YqeY